MSEGFQLTRSARAGMLLNFILERNTNEAYEDFLHVLKTDHPSLISVIRNVQFNSAMCVRDIDCHEILVLGNFPKLPPYYIERTSKVSPQNQFHLTYSTCTFLCEFQSKLIFCL